MALNIQAASNFKCQACGGDGSVTDTETGIAGECPGCDGWGQFIVATDESDPALPKIYVLTYKFYREVLPAP